MGNSNEKDVDAGTRFGRFRQKAFELWAVFSAWALCVSPGVCLDYRLGYLEPSGTSIFTPGVFLSAILLAFLFHPILRWLMT
jgi:hypothetical protein